jgi:4-amino-4-deoxy-L-arabinose transferase-like glycosyltransferase
MVDKPHLPPALPVSGDPAAPLIPGKLEIWVDMSEGDTVTITVESPDGEPTQPELARRLPPAAFEESVDHPLRQPVPAQVSPRAQIQNLLRNFQGSLRGGSPKLSWNLLRRGLSFERSLFILALLVYLATRLVGLADFPVYFFTDEAVQTVLAADLVRDNFQNYDHDVLPTYFVNGSQYNLSTSVYAQVIPYLLLGKSVEVTRGISVLISLLAAAAIGLSLRDVFKIRAWWLGVLFLSTAPAWFLHSRTAFETAEMTSFYAVFLYFYLMYRHRSPKYLYPALAAGALVFYTYSPGQIIMLVTGALLLVSDARYHWQNRRTGLVGLCLLVVCALPYVRFLLTRGAENTRHLQILNSYWLTPLPFADKVSRYFRELVLGLSPSYWFLPNQVDMARHQMFGYGHLPAFTLPLFLVGIGLAFARIKQSPYRTLLIALVAAPSGAAIVQVGITRVLAFVIPAVLLITLGLVLLLRLLERWRWAWWGAALLVFTGLVAFNIGMLQDALVNGPRWYEDYGLGGVQYGGRQVFSAVQAYVEQHPGAHVLVSPSWSNGTDVVARFFLPDNSPILLGSVDGYFFEKKPLDESMLFVMIPEEYKRVVESKKFTAITIEKTLNYPNGAPGFYFVRMRYVDQIDQILEDERLARKKLIQETITWGDQRVDVQYSMLDMGSVQNIFDGNPDSLARGLEANPLELVIQLPEPRRANGISVRIGGTPTRITVTLQVAGQEKAVVFQSDFAENPLARTVRMDFNQTLDVQSLRVEIESTRDGEPAHVHVWEISLQ